MGDLGQGVRRGVEVFSEGQAVHNAPLASGVQPLVEDNIMVWYLYVWHACINYVKGVGWGSGYKT